MNLRRSSWSNRSSFVHYQERSCARHKLDKTDTDRCQGIDELGWLVWHSAANWWLRNWSWRRRSQLTKKERDRHCQGLLLRERRRLSREDSTFCLLTVRLTDSLEVVLVVLRLHRMEERQNHMMTNAENESELLLREPWREKQGWMHTKTESLRQSEREEKSSIWERCRVMEPRNRWWADGGSTCGLIWRWHQR